LATLLATLTTTLLATLTGFLVLLARFVLLSLLAALSWLVALLVLLTLVILVRHSVSFPVVERNQPKADSFVPTEIITIIRIPLGYRPIELLQRGDRYSHRQSTGKSA
jgi:hypothetical protein